MLSESKHQDLVGHRYGLLTVLSFHSKVGNNRKWNCRCDCGVECVRYGHLMRARRVVSCGCQRRVCSDEHRRRISEALKTDSIRKKMRMSHLGKTLSVVTRKKMSEAKMGHPVPDDVRRRIGEATSKRESGFKGKKHSGDTKRKMRLAALDQISVQKFHGMPVMPRVGNGERDCLDSLQSVCHFRILRQYQVDGFFLDGYVKELNLAIEFDECWHKYKKMIARDKERREEIKRSLGCDFFVIGERDWDSPEAVRRNFLGRIGVAA